MKNFMQFVALAAAVLVGWMFVQSGAFKGINWLGNANQAAVGDSIRIGSFNIQQFGDNKVRQPQIVELLARVGRQFDILAIQEIESKQYDILPFFIAALNADGSQYDYVIGPRVGRGTHKEQFAFIFDTRSIEVDRNALYTIDDQNDLLEREPFVGWFRVRGPKQEEAFTFSLINVHSDPDLAVDEANALAYVYRAVRDDSRHEDDVIMVGDFNVNYRNMATLGQLPGLVAVINGPATMVRGDSANDNILCITPATSEFTGRGGVFDFMRDWNLTVEQALMVSDHLPVWAEFSVFEGGKPGQIAGPTYQQPDGEYYR
jgi:endonuclease/exonuclease/phosphatase family metal-dependent hydrolase